MIAQSKQKRIDDRQVQILCYYKGGRFSVVSNNLILAFRPADIMWEDTYGRASHN